MRISNSPFSINNSLNKNTILTVDSRGNEKPNTDVCEVSTATVMKYLEDFDTKLQEEVDKQKEKSGENKGDELGKILTIFRRIVSGDQVPAKDEKKLMEYSGKLYAAAKAVGKLSLNNAPKKHKSVDEEAKNRSLGMPNPKLDINSFYKMQETLDKINKVDKEWLATWK